MESYNEKLQQEADLWGSVAEQEVERVPPDWAVHRHLRHNTIMHTAHIDEMLSLVQPGMRTLELGCGSGWLTLAMAQCGADATGMDISEKSVRIAHDYYAATSSKVSGTATYAVADLNHLALAPNTYDMVVTRGTLHHLVELRHVIGQIHRALKPGGLFWASDQDGDEALSTAMVAGALMFVLPTTVSYREKFAGLARFGLAAPSRIKASMEAEGLSPFEGAGRDHDWVQLMSDAFTIERKIIKPAVTGYITHQLRLPDRTALPLLRGLHRLDQDLVDAGLLHSTGVILYARKSSH